MNGKRKNEQAVIGRKSILETMKFEHCHQQNTKVFVMEAELERTQKAKGNKKHSNDR